MKRILCAILSLLMVFMCFSGCKSKEQEDVPKEPITLTVVVENNFWDTESVQKVVSGLYPWITLEFVNLPLETAERESALTNLRAGILSGQGADIFLLGSWELSETTWDSSDPSVDNEYPRVDPLFESIEDAMNNGVFLILDEYMAESKYFGPEKQPQIVMDAGKTEYGQMVLPLYYSVPMYITDKNEMNDPNADLSSLDALLESGEDKLIYTTGLSYMDNGFASFFTHYEDENNNLILSEEEFTEAFMYAGRFFDAVAEYERAGNYGFAFYDPDSFYYSGDCTMDAFHQRYSNPDDTVPVVTHNIEGGVTAFIEAYGAINANTKHPDDAFKVLEIFFSDENQSLKGFYAGKTDNGNDIMMAFDMEVMYFNRERGISTCSAAFGETNALDYKYVEEINSMITHARFISEFDCVMADAWRELERKYRYISTMDVFDYDELVKELYNELNPKLKMIAAE